MNERTAAWGVLKSKAELAGAGEAEVGDVEAAGGVLEIIRSLKSDGLAILIVTHSLHFIASAADAIVFIDHGRIVESGGPEILQDPKTPRLQKFLSVIRSTH